MTIHRRKGEVKEITSDSVEISKISVEIAGELHPAINFNLMTGPVNEGDTVLLNTTAADLGLGSGGNHFVMANYSAKEDYAGCEPGHIMKIRYTPSQMKVMSVEEQDSPYHDIMEKAHTLNGTPVVCCSLHSMLPAAAASVKNYSDKLKVGYVMTDGAALPLKISNLVSRLRNEGLIDGSVSTGHSFGGDYEAVNIYSGLLVAKEILNVDVIIVSMGPGIVGSGTTYGFTGMEQADVINAAGVLDGFPVAAPRISFADQRPRHWGLSHHSRTVLGKAALKTAVIALPDIEEKKLESVIKALRESEVFKRHTAALEDGSGGLELLKKLGINVTTMGRSIEEDKEFFMASAAAGVIAAKAALKQNISYWEGGF